jgi:hypothetical protein
MAGLASHPLAHHEAELALEHWVVKQEEYFECRERRLERLLLLMENLVRALFWGGLFAVLGLAAVGTLNLAGRIPDSWRRCADSLANPDSQPCAWILLAIVMGAVVAALLHNYMQKTAFKEHVKQYRRMRDIFNYSRTRIERLLKDEKLPLVQREFLKLGDEALAENGDWVRTHRERPLEIPHH